MNAENCFGVDTAERLVTACVSEAERERLNAHGDECDACRKRLIDAAQSLVSQGASVLDCEGSLGPIVGDPASALPRGHTVAGRYVLLDILGQGGMGTVYLAHDGMLLREVALKITRRATPFSSSALQNEARAIAAVRHPNVVGVFDLAVDGARMAIAMAYVPGPTLRGWLATRKWPKRKVIGQLVALGEGLSAAHAANVVHGDVKLDNAVVDADGTVCITDFGLARLRGGDELCDQRGATPAYLAPEATDGRAADFARDQYALAASWVEALAGRRPDSSRGERWDEEPLKQCPRWLRAPLRRALDAKPERRHTSVAAFQTAI